jgi:hypothetical protein
MDTGVEYGYDPGSDPGGFLNSAGAAFDFSGAGGLGTAAAGLIGGLFGRSGAKSQNKANAKAAQKQMDFQERMSNTAYQRSVQDMIAAGINPMMAAKVGGASTPQGAMAHMENVGEKTASSAVQGATTAASLDQIKANTELAHSSARKADSEVALNAVQAEKYKQETVTSASSAGQMDATVREINQKIKGMIESFPNIEVERRLQEAHIRDVSGKALMHQFESELRTAQTARERQIIENMKFELARILPAKEKLLGAETSAASERASLDWKHGRTLDYDEPRQYAESESNKTQWGLRVRPFLPDAGKVLSSAAVAAGSVYGAGRAFGLKTPAGAAEALMPRKGYKRFN